MKAKIYVTLKPGVLDPQGKAIEGGLHALGFASVGEVRQGKYIEMDVAENDAGKAKAQIEEMCKQLLANTVIENYRIELN
jgi:phosphoribosylformylglycinamidine synthase subunit PurS